MLRSLAALLIPTAALLGAEWSWSWPVAAGAASPRAEICPFKYGKQWAYAIEIDDGPKWARSFAVPFLAEHHFTDAPPGVPGGKPRPFVGGIAVIVSTVGANAALVDWDDLAAMTAAGWGVINHSLNHAGRSWGDEAGRLSDAQVKEDGFWSQALLAVGMGTGRAPTAYVYANGYVDYNRGGLLASLGVSIATKVGGRVPTDVTRGEIAWLDFGRNYLDEGTWSKDQKGDPMSGIPVLDGDGPVDRLVIDFTHGIDAKAESPNHQRWRTRLSTIGERWGAKGRDNLWCAPTGEVADYLRAARVAKVTAARDRLTVSIPDGLPGSAMTVRLSGIPANVPLTAPAGAILHRQGDSVWLTTPPIGEPGAPAPLPHVRQVYAGPPGAIDLGKACEVAAVSVEIAHELPVKFSYRIVLHTTEGEHQLVEKNMPAGWFVGTNLHALVPTSAAITATGLTLVPRPGIKKVVVWAIDPAPAEKTRR
jgi:hypothetical protein